MASTVTLNYGSATSITITISSIGTSATVGREATAVNNTSNKFLDALLAGTFTMASGTPAGTKSIYIYALGSLNNTDWPDNTTGADAACTPTNKNNLVLLKAVDVQTASLTYKTEPVSVAAAFGGVLPPYWSIVLINDTGLTLSSGSLNYLGVKADNS